MTYYEPIKWASSDDQLVSSVEQILRSYKRAYPRQVGVGRSFLPPSAIELDITIKETREVLRLTEWEDKQGRLFIHLVYSSEFLRKGHFNHDWHHNPDGRNVPPPHHIHFPTMKYPKLEQPPTYAYPVKTNNDYLSTLIRFCEDTNIELRGVSIPLLRR